MGLMSLDSLQKVDNVLNSAVTLFEGYSFEISKNKIKTTKDEQKVIFGFIIKNKLFKSKESQDNILEKFIHYSFNVAASEPEIKIDVQSIFDEKILSMYKNGIRFKDYLKKYNFNFLYNYSFTSSSQLILSEEVERQRHYGSQNGLLWCSVNTSGYSKLSPSCTKCPNKVSCLLLRARKDDF